MRLILTLLITSQFLLCSFGQDRVIYHSFEPTASDWNIIDWNTTDTSNSAFLIKETVDKKGRTTQLEFLNEGKLILDHLCYLASRVTFEYQENLIIETLYSGDSPLLATDCEMFYKTIYHLDKDYYIQKAEFFAKYDFSNMDSTEINQWKAWVPEYKVSIADSNQLSIVYYFYSYSKLNGLFPTSINYELIEDSYYGDEPEKSSVRKGIEILQNNR